MKDWLASKQSPQVTVKLLKSNVGKGSAVNMVHSTARESDYIISIDGDMISIMRFPRPRRKYLKTKKGYWKLYS